MIKQYFFCLCLSLALFLMPFGVSANHHGMQRIDPAFFNETECSQEWLRVIIEFADDPGIEHWHKKEQDAALWSPSTMRDTMLKDLQPYQNLLMLKQEAFIGWASRNQIRILPDQHIVLVLNAISAEVMACDIKKVLQYPQVTYIHDDRAVNLPDRQIMSRTTRTHEVWKGIPDLDISAAMGERKVIGIIDTGLDRTHAEFSKIGKVRGGYNFANNNSDYSDSDSHGTHVGGIAAGEGNREDLRGMAFSAHLMGYRVFSPRDPGARNVLAAIDRGVSDRCDVLNLSLGRGTDMPSRGSTAEHRAIANADKAGVFVVASAGNRASRSKEIPWTIGAPSIVEEAFSVAASNDRREDVYLKVNMGKADERIIIGNQAPPTRHFTNELIQKEIVFGSYGRIEDLEKLELKGKIALIKRGPSPQGVSFREKVENAMSKGAEGVILFNHTAMERIVPLLLRGRELPDHARYLVPTMMLTLEDGEYLMKLLGRPYTIEVNYETTSIIAEFSSMGPSGDAMFKPEITAPGSEILSTVPGNRYAAYSGTSMSAPGIAGLVALVKQSQPRWTNSQIKSAFMNTAELMINPFTQLPTTFILQGAGSARLDRAISTPAFLEPRALVLDEAEGLIEHTITLTNAKNFQQEFSLSYEVFHFAHEPVPVSLSFEPQELKVQSGRSASFTVSFEIDSSSFSQSRYEGVIRVGEDLHIPFICYKGSAVKLEDPISNVRISNEKLDLTATGSEENQGTSISFSLNTGLMQSFVHQGQRVHRGSNYALVAITITDRSGEIWARLPELPTLIVGEYSFKWGGKNSQGRFFLPKGEFFVQVTMDRYELQNNRWVALPYGQERIPFTVVASHIPDPVPAIFSSYRNYMERKEIELGIRFAELGSIMGLNSGISSIELELHYDPDRLIYRNYQEKGFLQQYAKDFYLDVRENDHEGVISIEIDCSYAQPDLLNDQIFLTLVFRTIRTGRLTFRARAFVIHLDNGESVKVQSSMPVVRIVDRPFLTADINGDKIVDRLDFSIFMEAYGSKLGEKNYDERCDFNQDGMIDFSDFFTISREMNRYI